MSLGRSTVAFLVGQKNALAVVQFIAKRYNDISHFKLVVTMTEGKELENIRGIEGMSYVASLKDGGATEIGQRVSKKQIAAIFVFNAASIVHPKQFSSEKLVDLIALCWAHNTFICFNMDTVDLVIRQLTDVKGVDGKIDKSRANEVNKAMQQALLTRFPTFDIPLESKEQAFRQQVCAWTNQQLLYWLQSNSNPITPLIQLIHLFDVNLGSTSGIGEHSGTKDLGASGGISSNSGNSASGTGASEWAKYWVTYQEHFVQVSACPLDESLKLITLPKGAAIRRIWDLPTFQRDFLISHHVFTTSLDLMKNFRKIFKAGAPKNMGLEYVSSETNKKENRKKITEKKAQSPKRKK